MKNSRDIHGDGHGFVDVPVSRRASKVEVRMQRNAFTRDLRKLRANKEPFLGLYQNPDGSKLVMIIWRADEPTAGLNFLTLHGSSFPHYVTDPIGWADLPSFHLDNGVSP